MKYSVLSFGEEFDYYELERIVMSSDLKEEDVIIFVSKNFTSLMDSVKIKKFLAKSLPVLKKIDVFYLSYNSEACEEIKIIGRWNNIKFIKPHSPLGFDAIASSKKGWKNILKKLNYSDGNTLSSMMNNLIITDQITAISTWPRIFEHKLENMKTENNNEYSSCRSIGEKEPINKIQEISEYYYYTSFLFFSVFLIYLYYKKN